MLWLQYIFKIIHLKKWHWCSATLFRLTPVCWIIIFLYRIDICILHCFSHFSPINIQQSKFQMLHLYPVLSCFKRALICKWLNFPTHYFLYNVKIKFRTFMEMFDKQNYFVLFLKGITLPLFLQDHFIYFICFIVCWYLWKCSHLKKILNKLNSQI